MTSVADPSSLSSPSRKKSSKELVQDALDANKILQQILTHRAEQLEADLKEADSLLVSVPSFFNMSFSLTQDRMTRVYMILKSIQSRRLQYLEQRKPRIYSR